MAPKNLAGDDQKRQDLATVGSYSPPTANNSLTFEMASSAEEGLSSMENSDRNKDIATTFQASREASQLIRDLTPALLTLGDRIDNLNEKYQKVHDQVESGTDKPKEMAKESDELEDSPLAQSEHKKAIILRRLVLAGLIVFGLFDFSFCEGGMSAEECEMELQVFLIYTVFIVGPGLIIHSMGLLPQ
ncbi:uncharacterized protein GGS22DRAFT_196147 [Annulohypoxylon maeteangense]|uniref:uncharacterized protein n=1 Tax=Annulohypoxylon maeteangense TaxID=1927788 RepID=UPI0020083F5C|nr:uncharacterized protein GGS22DRAFT_196147 [Annulohypoxylon maeteangense]KAI0881982.1 hypothetical protein GGS22DRAFT_196147 [Annulohypoxylon maeteangense]